MTPETISAIGALWKLVFGVALIIALGLLGTIFKSQARTFLDRLSQFKLKRGDLEFSVNNQEERESNTLSEQESSPVSKEPGEEANAKRLASSENAPIEEEWGHKMILALFDGDSVKGKEAFEELQKSATDEKVRIENEAMYQFLRFRNGDTSALQNLKHLEARGRENHCIDSIQRWQAACYKFSEDYEMAAKLYRDAAENSSTEVTAASDLCRAAESLRKLERAEDARTLLVKALDKFVDPSARAKTYRGLADGFDSEKEPDKRATMLEMAVAEAPIDKDILFAAGYACAQAGMHELSLLHYERALQIDQKLEFAINNKGVEHANLGVPGLAVKDYKRAIELGNSLAAANLAYIYMESGNTEGAEEILKEARKMSDVHQNVDTAWVKLSSLRSDEEARKNIILKSAERQKRFLMAYASAMISSDKLEISEDAKWRSDSNESATVEKPDGTSLKVVWRLAENETSYKKPRLKFEGTLSGLIAHGKVLRWEREIFDFTNTGGYYKEIGRGQAYFSAAAGTLTLFYIDSESAESHSVEFAHITNSGEEREK